MLGKVTVTNFRSRHLIHIYPKTKDQKREKNSQYGTSQITFAVGLCQSTGTINGSVQTRQASCCRHIIPGQMSTLTAGLL